MSAKRVIQPASFIRRFIASWLVAVTAEYMLLPIELRSLQDTDFLTGMSFVRLMIILFAVFIVLCICDGSTQERFLIVGVFAVYSIICLIHTFSLPFLIAVCLLLIILAYYGVKGWNCTSLSTPNEYGTTKHTKWIIAVAAISFILFVSAWTVCRVLSFSTPTYDFGIFSQMFYNMKETCQPLTTLERDGLLSHFQVHVSPIYYLLLPAYWLFPHPVTLQILQAIVLGSAVIPLYLIVKAKGLHPIIGTMLSVLLLVYPSYSGGTSYDIHENAFLAPLLFWLFYGFEKKNHLLTAIFALLLLMVKEDAAVYVAIVALFFLIQGLLHHDSARITPALIVIMGAIVWFLVVTGYLSSKGDGVMTYRYRNFMIDADGSLMSVIKAVLLCPMKAIYECVDKEKISFIAYTFLPLILILALTRRYERFILLIPYVLVNLMSDYQYQHDIFFQYTFGSTACLFYFVIINLADIKDKWKQILLLIISTSICISMFAATVFPKGTGYIQRYLRNYDHYGKIEQVLSTIPDNASVSASTFYTTYLSQRPVVYDVKYATSDHILATEYIVLSMKDSNFGELEAMLQDHGYQLFSQMDNIIQIFHKP